MDADKQSEAIVDQFVSTLGLTDVILGGLARYSQHLAATASKATTLPSTGHEVADIALLVCASAFVGRLLTLIITMNMALLNVMMRRHRYVNELRIALRDVTGRDTGRPLDTAVEVIRGLSATRGHALDSARTHTSLSYGAAILSFTYACSLSHTIGFVTSRRLVIAGTAFVVMGLFQQMHRYVLATEMLRSLTTRPRDEHGQSA